MPASEHCTLALLVERLTLPGRAVRPQKGKEEHMTARLSEASQGKILEVLVTDKLSHDDYQQFVPAFERRLKEHGKVRVLFEMVDFHGWQASALWDDVKFDLKHFSDIERLAMVGDKKWEQGM